MERTVQEKRKKYLVIIPIVIAGLIIGSLLFTQNSMERGNAKTINDGITPLAGPTSHLDTDSSITPTPVIEAADGTIISNGKNDSSEAERAQNIRQLTEKLDAAQEGLDAANDELASAQEALTAAQTKADATQDALEAANKAVEEAQAKVDGYNNLKRVYEAAIAMTAVVDNANVNKENKDEAVMIGYMPQVDGTYKDMKNLGTYFSGSNGYCLNSTGGNFAPGFNEYVKQKTGVDISGYFYRVYNNGGKINVFISTEKFWTENEDGSITLDKANVDVYKFHGKEDGYKEGTLIQGTAATTTVEKNGADSPEHATIKGTLSNVNDDLATYDEIKAAEDALAAAKADQQIAAAADEEAQQEAKDAEADVAKKQEAANAAQEDADSAQAALDAASAQ